MTESKQKEVRFDIWCDKCQYADLDESEDPCNECLYNPFNTDSHKPVCFKEKEDK